MFQQAGLHYAPPIVAANAIGVCAMVQEGIGIGMMNPLMLSQDIFPGVVTRPFRPRVMLRTCTYYSKLHDLTPAVARFADCLSQAAKTVQRRIKASFTLCGRPFHACYRATRHVTSGNA